MARLILRKVPEYNYLAVFNGAQTIRFDCGEPKELPADASEFYDVSLGTKCTTGNCPFCYASANKNGVYYSNVCDTWRKWMSVTKYKPFQIAIGSGGEPTEHPEFAEFLKTVRETGVVPNYTTNGVVISNCLKDDPILKATKKYCGGVAISYSNPFLREYALQALLKLKDIIRVALHFVIATKEDVDTYFRVIDGTHEYVWKYTFLPMIAQGRSTKSINKETWEYLERKILDSEYCEKFSFGAKFIPFLKSSPLREMIWMHKEGLYSKNALLTPDKVILTRSSFDLRPIKEIDLASVTL